MDSSFTEWEHFYYQVVVKRERFKMYIFLFNLKKNEYV